MVGGAEWAFAFPLAFGDGQVISPERFEHQECSTLPGGRVPADVSRRGVTTNETAIIVVPCFNEAARLDVSAFTRFVEAEHRYRLLFVDDGSQDNTGQLLEAMAHEHPDRIAVLRLDRNCGKAEAVRRGLLAALDQGPATIGFWDADLATPLESLGDFARVMETRPSVSIVMGARVKLLGRAVHRSVGRHYIGRVFATAVSFILRMPVYDTQCGAKLFRGDGEIRRTLETPFITRWIFDVEILARFALGRGGLGLPDVKTAIYEMPLPTWHDVAGTRIRVRDFLRAPLDILRIWWAYGRDSKRRFLGEERRLGGGADTSGSWTSDGGEAKHEFPGSKRS
jgi:dolichyl-phosphate beta-glucosyltransferase